VSIQVKCDNESEIFGIQEYERSPKYKTSSTGQFFHLVKVF
jgi:hypothetical protein